MVIDGERFGEEIGKVMSTWDEQDRKLVLAYPTLNPVKSHVNRFAFLGSDCVSG